MLSYDAPIFLDRSHTRIQYVSDTILVGYFYMTSTCI